jgi:membrane-associated phospholipid phosphatase
MATPEQAVEEVVSGDVGRAGRRWLAVVTVVAFAAFVLNSVAVALAGVLPFDLPIALFVQRLPWGPLTRAMDLTNVLGGTYQVAVGAAIVVLAALLDRRAGWLMVIGALASLFDNVVKLSFERHRPPADLVHVLTPASGYSYPSGHAVFFTWLSFMLAYSVAPMLRPRLRPLAWALAGVVIATACLGRVWAGVHWPSDVLGGFLLGLSWSAFVLWLPERWLPQPSLHRLRRPRRPT